MPIAGCGVPPVIAVGKPPDQRFVPVPTALILQKYGRFMGVKLAAGGQPHRALLGRNLLQAMLLVYDGRNGSVQLAC